MSPEKQDRHSLAHAPLGAVAGYTQLWLMPGSQEIKGGRV